MRRLNSCNTVFNLITVPDLEFNPALPTVPYLGIEKQNEFSVEPLITLISGRFEVFQPRNLQKRTSYLVYYKVPTTGDKKYFNFIEELKCERQLIGKSQ